MLPHLALALLPLLQTQAPRTPATATASPLARADQVRLVGVVGRNDSIPFGSLLEVDLAASTVTDRGAITGLPSIRGSYYPADSAPDPDRRHLWVAYGWLDGAPAEWHALVARVDLRTRKAERVLRMSEPVSLEALAFDAQGSLYGVIVSELPNVLVRVDVQTGALQRLGPIAAGTPAPIEGHVVRALTIHAGEGWALRERMAATGETVHELLRIDLANGAVQTTRALALRDAIGAVALERLPSGRFAVALQPHGGPDAPPLSMAVADAETGKVQGLFESFLVPHGMHVAR
jgi:hypothetical protein